MKIIDMFSGCGGLTEGFMNEHFEVVAHIEMDYDACLSLKTRNAFHFLNENGQLDIYNEYLSGEVSREELYKKIPNKLLNKVICTEISSKTINEIFSQIDKNISSGKIDGIIGGPPCQAYSTIGRARNKKIIAQDERIYLYEYYIKFLENYNPEFFLFENVKGLLSFKDQYNELLFPKIIKAFSEIGYSIAYKVINTSDYGVSQNRQRLFIFGQKNNSNLLDSQDNFFELLQDHFETPISVNELFSDLPPMVDGETNNEYYKNNSINDKLEYYKKNKTGLSQNISRKHNPRDREIYRIASKLKIQGKQLKYGDLPSHLQTHKNKHSFTDRYKVVDGEGYSHTIVAHISKDGHYYIHPDIKQNRSISVREAARIQSFPDDFYFEKSRTSAYKQIGNAVPPKLSHKLSKTIISKKKKPI